MRFSFSYVLIKKEATDRSIKDEYSVISRGSMTIEAIKWWKGLGKELQEDIEALDE